MLALKMIIFTAAALEAWKVALANPPRIQHARPIWKPKFPLKRKLPPANDSWTKEEWSRKGQFM